MMKRDQIGFGFSLFILALMMGCGAASPEAAPLNEAGGTDGAESDAFGEAATGGDKTWCSATPNEGSCFFI